MISRNTTCSTLAAASSFSIPDSVFKHLWELQISHIVDTSPDRAECFARDYHLIAPPSCLEPLLPLAAIVYPS